jgi:hypothetical protein
VRLRHDEDAQAEGEAPGILSPGARGYIWYYHVVVPPLNVALPIPVLTTDHPPAGEWAELFTYAPATDANYGFSGLDLPEAQRVARRLVRAFQAYGASAPLP